MSDLVKRLKHFFFPDQPSRRAHTPDLLFASGRGRDNRTAASDQVLKPAAQQFQCPTRLSTSLGWRYDVAKECWTNGCAGNHAGNLRRQFFSIESR